jgi:hypothetical protein
VLARGSAARSRITPTIAGVTKPGREAETFPFSTDDPEAKRDDRLE